MPVDKNRLYETLYKKALEGDTDCGGLLSYNYFSGEHITHFEEGRPLFVRMPDSRFTLANFMRTHLYTALGALKIGMDRTYYSSVEAGKRNISIINICKIAKGFNITLSDLFDKIDYNEVDIYD